MQFFSELLLSQLLSYEAEFILLGMIDSWKYKVGLQNFIFKVMTLIFESGVALDE